MSKRNLSRINRRNSLIGLNLLRLFTVFFILTAVSSCGLLKNYRKSTFNEQFHQKIDSTVHAVLAQKLNVKTLSAENSTSNHVVKAAEISIDQNGNIKATGDAELYQSREESKTRSSDTQHEIQQNYNKSISVEIDSTKNQMIKSSEASASFKIAWKWVLILALLLTLLFVFRKRIWKGLIRMIVAPP